ncbi:hypothetical protein BABINDRAFT_6706 [Babjeviella inositovora NRRL Y-12698]|uniref:Protein kinase domain-containing protein n=1 Tax=Babjeviella inositovora NRRL Y-12698 TaxID=984486 RepID=A0A1E3QYF0_9ASCO|nr:uncharacterized protein BABINDRAFT_6706 [Babjeviella inositovora NRRL Y-12698]ODQ82097.1 hypothetical protein BABINDRAFT_6706 [Babjeviella inositovora NRRL Y-12698]
MTYINRTRINGGLFSDVYRAKDSRSNGVVALKIADPDLEQLPHNCRNEVKILKSLEPHAEANHLVRLLDSFTLGDDIVMVFPLLPYDLKDVISHNSRAYMPPSFYHPVPSEESGVPTRKNKMTESRAAEIVTTLLSSLAFLHARGVIHRDIKPANILFSTLDGLPILGDFGIVWAPELDVEPPREKICDVSTGVYRAPELLFSVREYTEKIDIWSLGVLLTVLYSLDCQPVFRDAARHSDLALMASIFEVFGTAGLGSWREVQEKEAFQAMNFIERPALEVKKILPRADDTVCAVFSKMMVYQSTERISANEALQMLALFSGGIRQEVG